VALFEIVPNFSEGRDPAFLAAAAEAAKSAGAHVLHVGADVTHHRSVLTLAGSGEQVVQAGIALAELAAARIDLRRHGGAHPRIGALDVLPFVPLEGAGLSEAAALAHRAGAEIWRRFGIPSFYYGAAAREDDRRLLPQVRRGGFEGLEARFGDPRWKPDEGDVAKHPSAGAIAIGARDILIAFNVELESEDLEAAREIARMVRERGGGLQGLRALAFPTESGRVQVSLNVTNFRATPLYRVVGLIGRLAAERGIGLQRGELIGCLPLAAVAESAAYYLGVSSL
jgi:glutamate formiminotransferase / 5-formyltetrahydrofolate cyclo-ligase